MGVAAAAHRRPWPADAGIGSVLRPRIRWPASSGHPGCRERATYVPGPGRCEQLGGRWHSSSEPGFAARSRGVGSSLAGRIRGEEKIFCRVTTPGRNFRVLNSLGRDFGSLPALLLGLGMLHFDAGVLATFSLAARRLPAADFTQAFRVLAIALVPAPRQVLASASFAQAGPTAWSAPSGRTAVLSRTLASAHGRCHSQGRSSGRMLRHSPRASSKLEQDACLPIYRLLENKTERQTVPLTRWEQGPRALPFKRSTTREQDRETNGPVDVLGTRAPSAALQTIEHAAGSEIGPKPVDVDDLGKQDCGCGLADTGDGEELGMGRAGEFSEGFGQEFLH